MSKKILFLSLNLFFAVASAFSQEAESAVSSNLLVSLSAKAQQIRPARIPEKISSTLGKSASMGDGKSRSGDSEVLAWADENHKKANAATIINGLTDMLKVADWKYKVCVVAGYFSSLDSKSEISLSLSEHFIRLTKSTNLGSLRSGAKSTSLSSQINQILRSS